MTSSTAVVIAAVLGSGGVGSVVTAWISRRPRPVERENSIIDQLQEENCKLSTRLDKAEKKIDSLHDRERILIGYVYELYAHIAEGKPPPPPPMPELT